MIAGVCGGVAAYLSVDSTLVRLITVVLAVIGGTGVVLYLAAWLLLPLEGSDRSIAQRLFRTGSTQERSRQ